MVVMLGRLGGLERGVMVVQRMRMPVVGLWMVVVPVAAALRWRVVEGQSLVRKLRWVVPGGGVQGTWT